MTSSHDGIHNDADHDRFKVVIAGGGVAALEAAFALRELAGDRVEVTVVAVGADFVYRPLSIGEPFNRGHAMRFGLAQLVQEAGAELVRDALVGVDVDARRARLASGATLDYDALLVALGARMDSAYEHATTVDDTRMDALLHGLVQDIEDGYVRRLAVVIPAPMPWPFPAYELALMAAERAWDMQTELDVVLITPERAPLDVFGATVSREVSALLAERRIEVIASAYCEIPQSQTVVVHPGGRVVQAERIVALPALGGPELDGLPRDGGGFIPVDAFGHVHCADRVWAAGDCTDEPIKLGGLAAALADVAAESIASSAGGRPRTRTFIPTIEGVLMTGGTPRYLRARPAWPGPDGESVFSTVPRSSAPPKIHARYLGPHLAAVKAHAAAR
jgi:sulfide:quinone oxidoreductase